MPSPYEIGAKSPLSGRRHTWPTLELSSGAASPLALTSGEAGAASAPRGPASGHDPPDPDTLEAPKPSASALEP